MKNNYIDRTLIREGMRQLRLPGYLAMLFLGIECILLPVGQVIQNWDAAEDLSKISLNLLGMHPGAFAVVVLAPFLVLALFSFLTQRNACDFYHSIPQTRVCLYNSFVAAVLIWSFLLQWGSTLVSMLVHLALGRFFVFDIRTILIESCIVSMTIILSAGGAALAVGLTGTILSNVIVTGMILFAPRMIMLVIKQIVGSSMSVVYGEEYLTFLGNGWNELTGSIFGCFSDFELNLTESWQAGLYTLALGLIYLTIGMVCFHRRKSETAGLSACNSGVQMVFRLCPAFIFCLIPNVSVFKWLTSRSSSVTMTSVYQVCVLYLIGILIYFLYELITTRKWKNMLRIAPGLAILFMLNILTIFGSFGMQRQVLSVVPEASEIESVSIRRGVTNSSVWDDRSMSYYDGYLTSRTANVQLTDPELLELVSNRLKDNVESDTYGEDYYTGGSDTLVVRINCLNDRSYIRQIRVTNADIHEIAAILMNNEEYRKAFMDLPAEDDAGLSLFLNDSRDADWARAVYAALKEDIEDMGFVDWYKYCTSYVEYSTFCDSLEMIYQDGNKMTASSFPITDLTPKAAQVFMDYTVKNQADERDDLVRHLKQLWKDLYTYEGQVSMDWCNFYFSGLELNSEGIQTPVTGDLSQPDLEETLNLIITVIEEQSLSQGIRMDGEFASFIIEFEFSIPVDEETDLSVYSDLNTYSTSGGRVGYTYDNTLYIDLGCLTPETRAALDATITN